MYIYIHVFYLASKHPGFTSLTIRDSDLSKTKGWFKKTFGWGYDHAKGRNKSNREETIQWFQYIYIIYTYICTYGGDSSSVQDQLNNVQQICGMAGAFASILAHRSVVTIGDMGQSRLWWWQLQRPAQDCPADLWHGRCFCCHFGTWKRGDMGHSRLWWWQLQRPRSAQECSADLWHGRRFCYMEALWHGASKTMVATAPASSSRMSGRSVARPVLLLPFWHMEAWWHGALKTMVVTAPASKISSRMFSRSVARPALLLHGSVVTWGKQDYGGDSSSVQLKNVRQICGTADAFAAILEDGAVVIWGNPGHGGDSSRVQDQLKNVQQICGTVGAFAAILAHRSVVTIGDMGQSRLWWWQL